MAALLPMSERTRPLQAGSVHTRAFWGERRTACGRHWALGFEEAVGERFTRLLGRKASEATPKRAPAGTRGSQKLGRGRPSEECFQGSGSAAAAAFPPSPRPAPWPLSSPLQGSPSSLTRTPHRCPPGRLRPGTWCRVTSPRAPPPPGSRARLPGTRQALEAGRRPGHLGTGGARPSWAAPARPSPHRRHWASSGSLRGAEPPHRAPALRFLSLPLPRILSLLCSRSSRITFYSPPFHLQQRVQETGFNHPTLRQPAVGWLGSPCPPW